MVERGPPGTAHEECVYPSLLSWSAACDLLLAYHLDRGRSGGTG